MDTDTATTGWELGTLITVTGLLRQPNPLTRATATTVTTSKVRLTGSSGKTTWST
jgi:hypothetical protein